MKRVRVIMGDAERNYNFREAWERISKNLIISFPLFNKRATSSHIKYWKAVETRPLSVKEISKITNPSHWAIRDALNKHVRLDLISAERKQVPGKSPYHNFYFLTESGKDLLNSIGGVLNCE